MGNLQYEVFEISIIVNRLLAKINHHFLKPNLNKTFVA
jgi:hypothetical protein